MSLELKKISKTYYDTVLENLDFKVEDGQFISIMGPSGSGKSTLLKILGLQIRETSGSYVIKNIEVSSQSYKNRRKHLADLIGYVDQDVYLFDSLTIEENIKIGCYGANIKIDLNYLQQLLKYFKLEQHIDKYPFEISGGERQRVIIVRNLLKKPEILLMDEPTSSLDYKTSNDLMELIVKQQHDLKVTTIIVTHNPHIAQYTNRVVFIKNRKIFADIYRTEENFEERINKTQAAVYKGDYDRI